MSSEFLEALSIQRIRARPSVMALSGAETAGDDKNSSHRHERSPYGDVVIGVRLHRGPTLSHSLAEEQRNHQLALR